MSITEVIKTLKDFNVWRKGADIPQPYPHEIGNAIDGAVELLKQYKKDIDQNEDDLK